MDRTDIAIVLNTCPKYMYLLEAHIGLLRRYGPTCKWPIYLAIAIQPDARFQLFCKENSIEPIYLDAADADFLQSRHAAMQRLPEEVKYILPLQDDFLLERPGLDVGALASALSILDKEPTVASLRLMPCPGSSSKELVYNVWNRLGESDLLFSYQATIWRRSVYTRYMAELIKQGTEALTKYDTNGVADVSPISSAAWNTWAIQTNPAETFVGLQLLKTLFPTSIHLCWPRKSVWANAVYWCPWPYRPTAVVQGVLQPWAQELIRREGFVLNNHAPKTS